MLYSIIEADKNAIAERKFNSLLLEVCYYFKLLLLEDESNGTFISSSNKRNLHFTGLTEQN